MEYGVVIDAGSSGSRVRVYMWTPRDCSEGLPVNVHEIFNFKVVDKLKQNQNPAMYLYHILHMMKSSNGNLFHVTGPLCEEFTGHRWIPLRKDSDAELWCFFDQRLKKRLYKQSRRRWFETPSPSSWCHYNECTPQEEKYAHYIPISCVVGFVWLVYCKLGLNITHRGLMMASASSEFDLNYLLNSVFRLTIKTIPKLYLTDLCEGNSLARHTLKVYICVKDHDGWICSYGDVLDVINQTCLTKWGVRHNRIEFRLFGQISTVTATLAWTSCLISKIVGCACAGNAGNVFSHHRLQRKPPVSDPGMHHGTCRDACRDH